MNKQSQGNEKAIINVLSNGECTRIWRTVRQIENDGQVVTGKVKISGKTYKATRSSQEWEWTVDKN